MSDSAFENWKKGVDASNKFEQERRAKDAESQKKAYSTILGIHKANPPIFGPPVDGRSYEHGRNLGETFKVRGSNKGGYVAGPSYGSSKRSGSVGAAAAAFVVLLLFIVVVVGFAISGTNDDKKTTSNSDDTSASTPSQTPGASADSNPPIAKPSPLGISNTAAANSDTTSMQPPVPSTASTEATSADQAPTASSVPQVPLLFSRTYEASRDGMNNGCDQGTLSFAATFVSFICSSDSSKSVSPINASDVVGIDKNGIIVRPKQKYHFHIAGMRKDDTAPIFAEWLRNSGINPAALGN